MKKGLVALLVLIALIISACSDEEGSTNDEEQNLEETIEGNNKDEQEDEEKENDTSVEDEEDSEDVSGPFETQTEDQLDLTIGDTGRFDTDLTTFEITLEDAEIIEGELDGEQPQFDSIILLDITIKNTGEETHPVQDLMYGLEVTSDLRGTGMQNGVEYFDSVEEMTGELASGEEITGQFITEIRDAEEYYFRLRSGITGSGASNEVIWTIPDKEVR